MACDGQVSKAAGFRPARSRWLLSAAPNSQRVAASSGNRNPEKSRAQRRLARRTNLARADATARSPARSMQVAGPQQLIVASRAAKRILRGTILRNKR